MKKIISVFVPFLVVFVMSTIGFADSNTDLGYDVLKCFHPLDDYMSSKWGPWTERPSGNGVQRVGIIKSKGWASGKIWKMNAKVEVKEEDGDTLVRFTCLADEAPTRQYCEYENWKRVIK